MSRPDPPSSSLAVHAAAFILAALATTSTLLATSGIARAQRACAQRAFIAHLARADARAPDPAAAPAAPRPPRRLA
jgi:hypothetical protein